MDNWSSTYTLVDGQSAALAVPTSTGELCALVRRCAAAHMRIKVVGTGLSYSQMADATGRCQPVSLARLDRLVAVDARRGTATVQAGKRLGALHDELFDRHGLALVNFPVVDTVTVGGAVSAAAHGHGFALQTLSQDAVEIEFVDGTGNLRTTSPGDAGPAPLDALRVSLGLCGIITKVTLRVVRAEPLETRESNITVDDFCARFRDIQTSARFVKAWWFPPLPMLHLWQSSPTTAAVPAERVHADGDGGGDDDLTLELYRHAGTDPQRTREATRALLRLQYPHGRTTVNWPHKTLCLPSMPPKQLNAEWAVPIERAVDAIRLLSAYFAAHGDSMPFHYPIDIRCVGCGQDASERETAWLSPARGGVCFFGVLGYLLDSSAKGQWAVRQYLRDVEDLLVPLGARPHWPKYCFSEPGAQQSFDLAGLYPRWERFWALRDRLDPMRVFWNSYAAALRPLPRRVFRDGVSLPWLGMGGAGFGGTKAQPFYGPTSDEHAIRTVRWAIEQGIEYIDTSPFYGDSERRLGLALQGGYRSRVWISTKVGTRPGMVGYDAATVMRSVAKSLHDLGTDHVEVLLVHDPTPADMDTVLGPGGALEALLELKKQGVCRYIGIGVREHETLERFIRTGRCDVILTYFDYTLMDQSAARRLLPLAQRYGVAVVNGSPYAMGVLSGVDPHIKEKERAWKLDPKIVSRAREMYTWCKDRGISLRQLALHFAVRHPAIGMTLVGVRNPQEIIENLRDASAPIDADAARKFFERFGVEEARARL